MRFKTLFQMGLTFSLAALPLVAKADLTISNHTKSTYTAVLVTSNPVIGCSGKIPLFPDFTSPGEPNHLVAWPKVKLLCGSLKGICIADVYGTKDCVPGTVIAKASMNLATGEVTIIENTKPKEFQVTASGSHVDINEVA